MSMRTSAIDDWGVILNGKLDDDTLQEWADDGAIEWSYCDWIETYRVNDKCGEIWDTADYFDGDTVYWVSLGKWPTMFKAQFENMAELVKHMEEQIKIVDDDLLSKVNVREDFRRITGAYTG